MRCQLLALAAGLAFFYGLIPGAHAGELVWSGLVVATNAPHPTPPPPEMHSLDRTLQHTFGYNQFEVIGQSRKALQTGEENWLAASKHFSLHVDAWARPTTAIGSISSCSRIGRSCWKPTRP